MWTFLLLGFLSMLLLLVLFQLNQAVRTYALASVIFLKILGTIVIGIIIVVEFILHPFVAVGLIYIINPLLSALISVVTTFTIRFDAIVISPDFILDVGSDFITITRSLMSSANELIITKVNVTYEYNTAEFSLNEVTSVFAQFLMLITNSIDAIFLALVNLTEGNDILHSTAQFLYLLIHGLMTGINDVIMDVFG